MDQLVIGQKSDGKMILDQPRFDAGGWVEQYQVRLTSKDLNVIKIVQNPPYSEILSDFFADLNNNWKGWEGEKDWRAIDGEYQIRASSSKTGHVALNVTVNFNEYRWQTVAEISVEAGQLMKIEKDVKKFFKTK